MFLKIIFVKFHLNLITSVDRRITKLQQLLISMFPVCEQTGIRTS